MTKDFDQISSLLQQAHKDAQKKGGYRPSGDAFEGLGNASEDPVLDFKRRMMISAIVRRRINKFQRESKRLLEPHQWVMLILGVILFSMILSYSVLQMTRSAQYKRFIKNGQEAIMNNDLSTATKIYEEMGKSMPLNLFKLSLVYGNTFEHQHDFENALKYYRYALVANQDLLEPYLYFAKYHYRKGDHARALVEINKILSKIPNYVEALRLRGKIFYDEYKMDLAEKDFEQIVKLFLSDFSAHYYLQKIYESKGEYKKSEQERKFLLQSDIENVMDVNSLLGVANSLLSDNFLDDASGIIKQALKVDKQSQEAYFLNARIKVAKDDITGALDDINLALKYSNDFYPEAHNLRGEIYYYKNKQVEEAVREFKIAQIQNPRLAETHFNLAQVMYYELFDADGIWKNILEEYLLSVEYGFPFKDDPVFRYNLGVTYFQNRDYKMSIDTLIPLLEIYPQKPELLYVLGNAYYMLGDIDKSIENYETALKMDVKFYKVMNNLSVAFEQAGEKKKALENFWIMVKNNKLSPKEKIIANKNLKRMLKGAPVGNVEDALLIDIPRWL